MTRKPETPSAEKTALVTVPKETEEVEARLPIEYRESKTEAIRQLWEENPELNPTQIMRELARRGVLVSRPTIYKVKQELRRASAVNQPPSLEDLLELKRLAANFGGIDRLKQMCEMLEKLQL